MNRDTRLYPAILSVVVLMLLLLLQWATPALAIDSPKAPTIKDLIEEEPKKEDKPAQAAVLKAIPQDEFNRGTPRSSVMGIAEALKNRDYARAMNYLDMRNLPAYITSKDQELARQLKIIVDRSLWADPDTISDDPKGHKDDGLPDNRDIIGRLSIPDGAVDILMQHIPDGKGAYVWKLSNHTVSEIPRLYEHYGYGKYGDKLARMLPESEFFGLVVWQWVMLIGILIAAFVISWIITRIACLILRLSLSKERGYERLHRFIAGPIQFLIFIVIIRMNYELISPTYTAKAVFEAKTLEIIAVAWLITGVVKLAFGRLADRLKANGNEQAIVLLRPAATLVNVVIILIAAISWLDNLGFNVSAMLAGLGVGGIAIGLAAQKSIENLLGGITLYAAQPIRIGDFCRAGSTLGIVEEIGLRSTAIRTLERTLVTIPNASMASMDIENLTKRDKILYRRGVRLRNDTTPDQVRAVLAGVRKMFETHADVDPVPARIRFTEYGEHSLNLEIFAYITTRDFNEYLGSVEDLNLRILDIIAAAGAQLALPARSIRFEGEGSTA
ncbi:MAG: mechanosensitive ion channel family protein [Pseudomonadota bacterium]|nr:mechanosensitive ion channel family protein [Pseudomonadota bacterium]